MSATSPALFYADQRSHYAAVLEAASRRIKAIAQLRLLTALGAIALLVIAINDGQSWQWALTGLSTAMFLVWVRIHTRLHEQEKLLQIRIYIIEQEQAALSGNHTSFADGAVYTDATHPYTYDLDIFGKGSLYQLLCRTVTENGSRLLAEHLKEPVREPETILQRQGIIRALSQAPEFLVNFRVAGLSVIEEPTDYTLVTRWLSAKDDFLNNPIARIAIWVMPLSTIGLIIFSILREAVHPLLGIAVAVNWIILMPFQRKIKTANAQIGKTAGLIEKYQRLQEQVAAISFRHPWLKGISEQCKSALMQITKFQKLATTFDARNNSMVGPLMNSLFLFDIYCLLRLEGWRRTHKQMMLETLEAIIVLDEYVSCGVYAYNHPENTYPHIDTDSLIIKAEDLRHPLLSGNSVGNDCSLGEKEQFYLLTGANMTGKSTFIRTVGISTVVSYLGLPVTCKYLSLPLLKLYTAMRITDSVQDDVSYFRAELNRIQAIMTAVQSAADTYLVLLDEPLRGTNSADKQQGTRAIIESLIRYKAVGIVATHDIGLCALADEYPGKVSNYHFESTVADHGLAFDFKLYPGGSTSNNATILMRQMGIIQ